LIAARIQLATVLGAVPPGTGIVPVMTWAEPIVMPLMAPPAALIEVTRTLPSDWRAGTVPLTVVPMCLAWMKLPIFLRWQLVIVVLLVHQRTPKNVCAAVTPAPAAQLVRSTSVQNSGAGNRCPPTPGLIEEPLTQLVRAASLQNCRVCMR
jgi:hypothetical protein